MSEKKTDIIDIACGVFIAGGLIMALSGAPEGDIETVWYKSNYDRTDDVKNNKKSGLGLYIDYGTGCQYLQAGPFGGITPRLDGMGNHVCKEIK